MFEKKSKFLTIVMAVMGLFSAITVPAFSQIHYISDNLLKVNDAYVKRILPVIESDSVYADAEYIEFHFKQNDADLDMSHMDNRMALSYLNKAIDSLGINNITAIEIVSQASPDGIVSRNVWLSERRSQIIRDYVNSNYPQLKKRISINAVTESWDNLARYVAQDPNLCDENREKVLNIINSDTLSVGQKKATIKTVGTDSIVGDVYEYLLTNYYAVIRNTGIYILHNAKSATAAVISSSGTSSGTSHVDRQSSLARAQAMTIAAFAKARPISANLLQVGDTTVNRIMPIPESDSTYADADYTEVHFRKNRADLDLKYMNNDSSLYHLNRVIDSIGLENISAVEIIAQASPEGIVSRNVWLSENRSLVILDYINRYFPQLKDKISINTVAESWDNLARYVVQDPNLSDENKEKVLDIIYSDKMTVGAKKSRIKVVGNDPKVGDVYTYLFKYYYPVIRNTGIYILHTVEPPTIFNKPPERPYLEEPELEPDPIHDVDRPESQPPVRKRPLLAVKTNIPYYGFFMPDLGWAPIYNIEAELYPTENGRWTMLAEYEFPWHSVPSKHQYFQILNLQLEARRYFKKASRHSGWYLSGYAGANLYDICFNRYSGHGYQGEGMGAGLGLGYVMPLGRPSTKWKLEFFVKGGGYVTLYDPYDAGNPFSGKYYYEWYDAPALFLRRNMIFRWLGPTGVGVSISYDLIHKKIKEK